MQSWKAEFKSPAPCNEYMFLWPQIWCKNRDRRRWIPGTQEPASLTKTMGFRFSERPCLGRSRSGIGQGTWCPPLVSAHTDSHIPHTHSHKCQCYWSAGPMRFTPWVFECFPSTCECLMHDCRDYSHLNKQNLISLFGYSNSSRPYICHGPEGRVQLFQWENLR